MSNQPNATADANCELARKITAAEPSLISEFVAFLANNKKWWLAPIIAIFLLVGLLVILGGTGAAPFIYTLF
ncbi:MAG: hypothetical protein JXO22_15920 [Phycisphaerae bacterium]|nr:hypothetical protein [Phycisphaerae bacterium]